MIRCLSVDMLFGISFHTPPEGNYPHRLSFYKDGYHNDFVQLRIPPLNAPAVCRLDFGLTGHTSFAEFCKSRGLFEDECRANHNCYLVPAHELGVTLIPKDGAFAGQQLKVIPHVNALILVNQRARLPKLVKSEEGGDLVQMVLPPVPRAERGFEPSSISSPEVTKELARLRAAQELGLPIDTDKDRCDFARKLIWRMVRIFDGLADKPQLGSF